MKDKQWLILLMAALLLWAVFLLVMVTRINAARSELSDSNPGAFNYLLQSHRNLDSFVQALRDYQEGRNSTAEEAALKRNYLQRFDVLWSGFTVFELDFHYQPERQAQARELVASTQDFLTRNEHLMSADHSLSEEEVASLIAGTRLLFEKVFDTGHQYFLYVSHLSDLWSDRLDGLRRWFLACVALLMLTGVLLIGVLVRSIRRSSELVDKSYKTQREMKWLIDELRSGKLESKAKDSFIAAASHDLRQPLHALGLFLGATEKHVDNEAGRQALAEAKQCAGELNKLFNSLLDLSRLDAGMVEVSKSTFSLDRLVKLMDQEFSVVARQSGMSYETSCLSHYVRTDALLLNRILRNLLENALTHSRASEVRIYCENKGDVVRLTVADNGVGIPVDEQTDIFSEYYQLENPERDRSKGLGLGLAIVKRLCDILGIELTLESEEGAGTRFHLDVPAGRAGGRSDQASPELEPGRDSRLATGALVAVIDDEPAICRGMVSMLESLYFRAVAAESADQLIVELQSRGLIPDFLVVDYRLRDNQTGDMAIRQVRTAFDEDFPAMIISGDTSPARMKEVAASGFEMMHKPVEPAELVRKISVTLQAKEACTLDAMEFSTNTA
ncbi:MAG: response regulator [Granulosicoccus sp.]|nr:response regulator [Granulosicoccus sp.]